MPRAHWFKQGLGAVLLLGCGSASTPPTAEAPAPVAAAARAESAPPEIEVLASDADAPPGSDAVPRSRLAFRMADGSRRPIDGQALAYVPFRDGVALIDERRQLVLVSPSGSRRVLVRESGAPPALGPAGELVYVARDDVSSDVHALDVAGNSRWLARGLASAGLLAPQRDGRVLFLGARHGGVAGVWLAGDGAEARCLTNCELRTADGDPARAEPWPGFIPPPSTAEGLRVRGDRAEWEAADGSRRSVSLRGASPSLPTVTAPGAVPPTRGGEP